MAPHRNRILAPGGERGGRWALHSGAVTEDTSRSERPHFTGLLERAEQVGRWVWVERRVFEVFGRWAGSCGDDVLDSFFADMSRRHGWHAEVLADRLPELTVVRIHDLVAPGSPETEEWFDLFEGDAETSGAIERAVSAYRVLLPMLVESYRDASGSMSPVAEPSLIRWTGIILADDIEEWEAGEEVVRSLLVDAGAVDEAKQCQQALELAAAGISAPIR